jgi:hypothetical protein
MFLKGKIESGTRGFETTRLRMGRKVEPRVDRRAEEPSRGQGTLLNKPEERQSDAVLIIVLLD